MRCAFLLLATLCLIGNTTAVFTPWDCNGEMCQLVKRDNTYTTVDWDVPRPRAFRFRFQPGIRKHTAVKLIPPYIENSHCPLDKFFPNRHSTRFIIHEKVQSPLSSPCQLTLVPTHFSSPDISLFHSNWPCSTVFRPMYPLFFFEFALHACSILTAVIVLLKINRYDKIGLAAKICISTIYSSVFLSDISYSYAVYIKCLRNQLTFNYDDVVTTEPNPIHQAIFCHEMGTWVYVWGVILTATERLLNSFNFRLRVGYSVFLVLSPFLALLIFGTSYFCTSLLLSADHQVKADFIIGASQIFGVSALMYTLYLNQRNYKNGVGQDLERRYQDAYVYKFNRSVLYSLIGEVLFRAAGFACILVVTTVPVRDQPAFGWLSFSYHNTIPVGSIVCPWFIVLRHVNLRQVLGRPCKSVAVSDLNGRSLAMRESTDEHFASLRRAWKEKEPR